MWDVRGMLRSMTAGQWREWCLYLESAPLREEDLQLVELLSRQMAEHTALVANLRTDPDSRARPYTYRDFMTWNRSRRVRRSAGPSPAQRPGRRPISGRASWSNFAGAISGATEDRHRKAQGR